MKNTKFKTKNLVSLSFVIEGGRADGFRHNFYRIRDYLNQTQAPHAHFREKDGTILFRPLSVTEMRKQLKEDEISVCNVSVRQKGNDCVATFTAPAKSIDRFLGRGDFLDASRIVYLWKSFNNGWTHADSLRPLPSEG